MNQAEFRKLSIIWPKVAEIFSASQTGLQNGPGGFEGGDDDGPETGGAFDDNGIQTEGGENIQTEGGENIKAENQ